MHVKDDGWLEDSFLPSNQLPLLHSMVGRRLTNIQRSLSSSPQRMIDYGQHYFREMEGVVVLQLEDLPLVYIDDYRYDKQERSLAISLELPWFGGWEADGRGRRFTLHDREYVDDRLHDLMGQRLKELYLLIRRQERQGDQYRALQDGLELTFQNGTTIVLCRFLARPAFGSLKIRYPEEIRWEAVQYKIDVTKAELPWLYRFNRWKWRFLYFLENKLDKQERGK